MALPMNYDELDDSYYVTYDMDSSIDYEIFKKKLNEFFSSLSIKKEVLIRLYFNIDDRDLSVKEINDLYNICVKTIYHHIYSLKKYSTKEIGLELKDLAYHEIFHEDSKKIIKRF